MNENTVNISDETAAKDSLETLPGRPKGWYVCPNCGAEYEELHHFCSKCNYYTPSWWHATDEAKKRDGLCSEMKPDNDVWWLVRKPL